MFGVNRKTNSLDQNNMASIKNMNLTIAEFLYGKDANLDVLSTNFHEDYNILMKAVEKAMGAGKQLPYDDMRTNMFWFAVYPEREILNKREGANKWWAKVSTFSCAFSPYGISRAGHGKKFNHEFEQSSLIRSIHYSLYRFIKNGLEY